MPHPAVIAQCPYYVRENQTTIFCESSIEVDAEAERYAAHIFGSCKEKTKYMKAHCGQYPNMGCPYADYMNRYYDGGKKHEYKNQKKKRKTGRDRKTEKGFDIVDPTDDTKTEEVEIDGVIGVAFDHWAGGINCPSRRVTTNYNAKAEFTNMFYKQDANYFVDLNENCVVFFIGDNAGA